MAAYYEEPNRRLVILGECTLEKPHAKLSPLKSRANQVRESLAGSAEVVLPVVFTACDPVQSDYENAANEGISLVGSGELATILQLVKNGAGSAAIVKEIEEAVANGCEMGTEVLTL